MSDNKVPAEAGALHLPVRRNIPQLLPPHLRAYQRLHRHLNRRRLRIPYRLRREAEVDVACHLLPYALFLLPRLFAVLAL